MLNLARFTRLSTCPILLRTVLAVFFGVVGLNAATNAPAPRLEDGLSAGPFAHEFPLTLVPGKRIEAAGPLLNIEDKDGQRTWSFTPLLSRTSDPELEMIEWDIAYPLLTYDQFGTEWRLQLIQLFSFAGGMSFKDDYRKRTTVFPFYFKQTSTVASNQYTAFLPFYGYLRNRFFRDEIKFILLPTYIQTRKRDIITDNYLAPFFHLRSGNHLTGWQFWPLAGAEHKTSYTITNTFDEVEVIPGHDKLFALWPIFFRNRLNLGTTNVLRQDMLLPFYSFQRSPARDHTSYLFPFFNYADDRENKYRQWDFPFPFISIARGEGKTMNRFLPFYSYAETPILTRQSILWPLYHHATAKVDPLDRERTRVLFFLYSNLRERNTATEQERRRVDLWPLFTKRKDFDGTERLQILAPVEPLLPNNKSIERNYSIVWSLWRSEHNPNTGAASTSVLWNLYRSDRAAGVKKVSFLFGLIQVESSPEYRKWRWFHLPVKPATGNK